MLFDDSVKFLFFFERAGTYSLFTPTEGSNSLDGDKGVQMVLDELFELSRCLEDKVHLLDSYMA